VFFVAILRAIPPFRFGRQLGFGVQAGEAMARIRIKPSRPQAALAMVVGIAFVGFGLLVGIPTFGVFGIFWTVMALAMTVYFAINAFSPRGLAHTEIDIEHDAEPEEGGLQFDERLRRLERLREEQLISAEEYERKREEIMGKSW
jgi:hypothetical protein